MTCRNKAPFPFPLQLGALDWFCHPYERHDFAHPVWHDGEALAANTYMALKFSKGLWKASDFAPASESYLARFHKLPWARFHAIPDDWKSLDDIRGHLYRSATIIPWHNGGTAPSPVWRVGDVFLARLSHLQLIARLPRCQVHVPASMSRETPLLIRFNGGIGMLAPDTRLSDPSFTVFAPARDEAGSVIVKNTMRGNLGTPPLPEPALSDWPPVDQSDS
jgi:hypothetical protein